MSVQPFRSSCEHFLDSHMLFLKHLFPRQEETTITQLAKGALVLAVYSLAFILSPFFGCGLLMVDALAAHIEKNVETWLIEASVRSPSLSILGQHNFPMSPHINPSTHAPGLDEDPCSIEI